jgi:hypothetical protein
VNGERWKNTKNEGALRVLILWLCIGFCLASENDVPRSYSRID